VKPTQVTTGSVTLSQPREAKERERSLNAGGLTERLPSRTPSQL
jgi:hypothetical protein